MVAKALSHIAIFAVGVLATLAFIGIYWQTNKDDLTQKALAKLATGNYCPGPDDSSVSNQTTESSPESKIYFVGCGGFF